MGWKVGHKSHLHNQEEVLSFYAVELLPVFEGDQQLCLPDLCIHSMVSPRCF